MGLMALGIPAYMLTSTTSKDDEKFIYRALEKGDGDLKMLYVTPEKISKSKRFMSKLEKCHNAGRLSLISIDVSCFHHENICGCFSWFSHFLIMSGLIHFIWAYEFTSTFWLNIFVARKMEILFFLFRFVSVKSLGFF